MKYYIKKRYVKLIPKKFYPIRNLEDFLDDLEHRRLSDTERENLKKELLRLHLENFLKEKNYDSNLRPYINGANPLVVLLVRTKHSEYAAVRFDNGIEVRCPKQLYTESPNKKEIKRLY